MQIPGTLVLARGIRTQQVIIKNAQNVHTSKTDKAPVINQKAQHPNRTWASKNQSSIDKLGKELSMDKEINK